MFSGGELKLLILALVAEKPRYGYEIIKDLGQRVGGDYRPSPGVVYPTLRLLLQTSYALAHLDPAGRKVYTLTAEGEKMMAANEARVHAIFGRFDEGTLARRTGMCSIARAFTNLDATVRLRLDGRGMKPQQVQDIIDTLEAAAKTIEQT